RAFLLTLGRIADPKVLYCVTIHDPAEQQLSLFMENGAVGAAERKVGIPSADETVKSFGFLANGRIRIRRSQQLDHCLSRRFCESFFSLFARALLWAHLRRRCDCHRNKHYQDERWRSTNASHNGDCTWLYCNGHAIQEDKLTSYSDAPSSTPRPFPRT